MTEIDINRPTLDSFFGSSSNPISYTKQLVREQFLLFDEKPIEGYRYKGKKAVTVIDLDNYIENRNYNTIYIAFNFLLCDFIRL